MTLYLKFSYLDRELFLGKKFPKEEFRKTKRQTDLKRFGPLEILWPSI